MLTMTYLCIMLYTYWMPRTRLKLYKTNATMPLKEDSATVCTLIVPVPSLDKEGVRH